MDELDELLDDMFGKKEKISAKVSQIEEDEKEALSDNIFSAGKVDFSGLAHTSDFKRLIYLAITGETFRGKNSTLDRVLNNKLKKLRGK